MLGIALSPRSGFVRGMSSLAPPQTPSEQARALGRALRALRDHQGLTQQEAADRYGVSRNSWIAYENGERQLILRSDIQTRLAVALNCEREELMLQLAALTPIRQRPGVAGLGEVANRPFDLGPDRQQAVFPLAEGEVVMTFPADLSPAGVAELAQYLALFLKARGGSSPT